MGPFLPCLCMAAVFLFAAECSHGPHRQFLGHAQTPRIDPFTAEKKQAETVITLNYFSENSFVRQLGCPWLSLVRPAAVFIPHHIPTFSEYCAGCPEAHSVAGLADALGEHMDLHRDRLWQAIFASPQRPAVGDYEAILACIAADLDRFMGRHLLAPEPSAGPAKALVAEFMLPGRCSTFAGELLGSANSFLVLTELSVGTVSRYVEFLETLDMRLAFHQDKREEPVIVRQLYGNGANYFAVIHGLRHFADCSLKETIVESMSHRSCYDLLRMQDTLRPLTDDELRVLGECRVAVGEKTASGYRCLGRINIPTLCRNGQPGEQPNLPLLHTAITQVIVMSYGNSFRIGISH